METHLFSGDLRAVGLLCVEGSTVIGDGVQFEAKGSWLIQPQRLQVLHRQIPAQIPVKFPVGRMTWIAVPR